MSALDIEAIRAAAEVLARYHRELSSYGDVAFELHERMESMLWTDVPALCNALVAERAEVARLRKALEDALAVCLEQTCVDPLGRTP